MKKRLFLTSLFAIAIIFIIFDSKFYYPTLPIDSVSKKKVLAAMDASTSQVVKIAEENGDEWFITRMDQGKGYEHIKKMIEVQGWEFQTQDGNGSFFEKDGKRLIAVTQMWTGKYVIVQIPNGWRG